MYFEKKLFVLRVILAALTCTLFLNACSGDNSEILVTGMNTEISSNQETADTSNYKRIIGAAAKGGLINATINIYSVDNYGYKAESNPISTTTTDATGMFSLDIPANSGALLLETSGGEFIDESDQEPDINLKRKIQFENGQGLTALLPEDESSVAITLVSQAILLKSRRETQNGNFLAVFAANQISATSAYGFDPVLIVPADTINPDPELSLENRQYALVLGGIANAINRISLELGVATPTFEIIAAVAEDLSDGLLNGFLEDAAVMVDVRGSQLPLSTYVNLNNEINRFRNNNFGSFGNTELPDVDDSILSERPAVNIPPSASAGADQNVIGNVTVTLSGSSSSDLDGSITNYTWSLLSDGTNITFADPSAESTTFIAPNVTATETIVIQLTVTDNNNATGSDELEIIVQPAGIPISSINISDSGLNSCIQSAAFSNNWLFIEEVIALNCSSHSISNLTGLENFTALTNLDLASNSISDISVLSSLIALQRLDIGNNSGLSDLTAISGLTSLSQLVISNNSLNDISAVSSLVSLQTLEIDNNAITDISPLSTLINLERLDASNNIIVDISPLSSLNLLIWIDLSNNQIIDISVYVSFSGLSSVLLTNNHVVDITVLFNMTNPVTISLVGNIGIPCVHLDNLQAVFPDTTFNREVAPDCATAGFVKWSFPTGGPINSSAAVANDGSIYFGSDDGNLYKLDSNGNPTWEFATGAAISSTPAIADSQSGEIIAFGSADGVFHIRSDDNLSGCSFDAGAPILGSPAINTSLNVIFFTAGSNMFQLDYNCSTTGANFVSSVGNMSSPSIASDGIVYVGSDDGFVYGVDMTLPSPNPAKWQYQTPTLAPVRSSAALHTDGSIFIGADDNTMYRLQRSVAPSLLAIWDVSASGVIESSPVLEPDGDLIFGSNDGTLYSTSSASGTPTGTNAVTSSPIRASAAIGANGNIYFGSSDGIFYALDPDGAALWQLDLNGPINSSPAIFSDGTILVGSGDNNFYAIASDAGGLANTDWPIFSHDLKRTGSLQFIPNIAPVANAGADTSTNEGVNVSLVGTGTDIDGDVVSYLWTQVSGSSGTLITPTQSTLDYIPPIISTASEVVTLELTVTDDDGATDSDFVNITVIKPNISPVIAIAGGDDEVHIPAGNSQILSAIASDADGSVVSYLWTQDSGTAATLNTPTSQTLNLTSPVIVNTEVLTFRVTVTDNDGATATVTKNLTVIGTADNIPPYAHAGADVASVAQNTSLTLGFSANDLDGTVVSYSWTQTAGTPGTLNTPTTLMLDLTTPFISGSSETLTFSLTITDNEGATDTDTVDVTVVQ